MDPNNDLIQADVEENDKGTTEDQNSNFGYGLRPRKPPVPKKKPNYCELCERQYKLKSKYEKHMTTHEEEWQFKCEECGKFFYEVRHLKTHIRVHILEDKPFSCIPCKLGFQSNPTYIEHMQIIHGEMQKQKPSQTRECEFCSEIFDTVSDFRTHTIKFHRDKIQVYKRRNGRKDFKIIRKKPEDYVQKSFKCDLCCVLLPSKTEFLTHMETHNQPKKSFSCEECGESFGNRKNLTDHQTIHDMDVSEEIPSANILSQIHKNDCEVVIKIEEQESVIEPSEDENYECDQSNECFNIKVETEEVDEDSNLIYTEIKIEPDYLL